VQRADEPLGLLLELNPREAVELLPELGRAAAQLLLEAGEARLGAHDLLKALALGAAQPQVPLARPRLHAVHQGDQGRRAAGADVQLG
jgi:isopentenyl diphosphate isomerase/L-lactate dehydrogenase-like FMN-dependent dehydrogenase